MGLKVLFLVQFGVALLFALSFILTPKKSMEMYGTTEINRTFELLTRLYGTVVLMYCLIAWFAAGMEDSVARRGIVITYAISMGASFIVFLPYMIKKTLNAFGWVPTALQGAFMVAYIYYAITMQV